MTPAGGYRWHIVMRYHDFDKDAWVTANTFADVLVALTNLYKEHDGLPIAISITQRIAA